MIGNVRIAGPGFVNVSLDKGWLARQVDRVLERGASYADLNLGEGRRAQVEFVSANPTGPLSVGHGRNAVIGDTLANVLEAAGWDVTREYYYNDGGRQMEVLGESVKLRLRELLGEDIDFPAEYYRGEYLREIAREILDECGPDAAGRDRTFFKEYAEERIFAGIRDSLGRLGVRLDVFTNETALRERGALELVLGQLRQKGYAYDAEGAIWLRSTGLGADKDRVLVRSNGQPTYRLPDIAYHVDKLERGFDLVVDILGSDHIAELPDITAALRALGYDAGVIRPVYHQFVTLIRDGQLVKMSTRRATFVTLDELVDLAGPDAVRFFMLMRSPASQMEFDLNLARERSENNPVYYVQYAHARAVGILDRTAPERGIVLDPSSDVTPLGHPSEMALVRDVLRLDEIIEQCAERLEPQYLTRTRATWRLHSTRSTGTAQCSRPMIRPCSRPG
jgi:arginyl-tRNA synthetase